MRSFGLASSTFGPPLAAVAWFHWQRTRHVPCQQKDVPVCGHHIPRCIQCDVPHRIQRLPRRCTRCQNMPHMCQMPGTTMGYQMSAKGCSCLWPSSFRTAFDATPGKHAGHHNWLTRSDSLLGRQKDKRSAAGGRENDLSSLHAKRRRCLRERRTDRGGSTHTEGAQRTLTDAAEGACRSSMLVITCAKSYGTHTQSVTHLSSTQQIFTVRRRVEVQRIFRESPHANGPTSTTICNDVMSLLLVHRKHQKIKFLPNDICAVVPPKLTRVPLGEVGCDVALQTPDAAELLSGCIAMDLVEVLYWWWPHTDRRWLHCPLQQNSLSISRIR
jgi:hypothetical protein